MKNRTEIAVMSKIADRAVEMAGSQGHNYKKSDALMDILAAHEACPLKLEELLLADDFNFSHDVFGINRHLNRRTFELEDCFLPRYAR